MSANVGLQNFPFSGKTSPKKTRNNQIFLGLCSDQQLSFSPCWIEHLFFIMITPRSFFFFFFFFLFFLLFFLSLQSSVNIVICHVTFVPYHYILPVKIVLCFDFLIKNKNTKKKFGWKLFILWVISYRLSFLGFAINLSSCLETLEIGQITKMTVHKKMSHKIKCSQPNLMILMLL